MQFNPTDRRWPPLPSENETRAILRLRRGDAALTVQALHWSADRCEGTASRMRGLAPELVKRAARLRRIAAAIEAEAAQ